MNDPIFPSNYLTVIIRDDSPMIHCGDCPSYRSVRIELTPDQTKKLALRHTSTSGGTNYYEQISHCFIDCFIDEGEE